jgi:type IV pilus assembly protein PilQ
MMKRTARPARPIGRWALCLLPILLGAGPLQGDDPSTRVTALHLAPGAEGTELLIEVAGGTARWSDFALDQPPRLVIDVLGARDALATNRFAELRRGGVQGVRTSQYAPDVVRVVVDLARATDYSVQATPEGIRVRLSTGGQAFDAWTSGPVSRTSLAADTRPVPAALPARNPQRITVTFEEADIRDVLASFAEFTGRSIVPGVGVNGTVSATIRDQPWDVALQTILRAYGLAAEELPSGIIRVDAFDKLQERRTQEPLVTRTFRVNYVPAGELATSLDPLRSDRGRISVNASTNTLVVTDVATVLDNVGGLLQQLDVRTPQVAIQAKIIFVNRTDVEELGIVYDLKDSQGSSLNRITTDPRTVAGQNGQNIVQLGGNSIAGLGNANVRVQGPQLETVISLLLGRFTLTAFIDALQAVELSDVQAAPLITTLDNQQAEIWVGERTPIRVVDVGTPGAGDSGFGGPRATAQLVETGIRLRVTPHITADRRILMDLHAERSSAQLAATDIGVVFQQQQGTTRLMVADGETAVIGGLTVTEVATTRAGIPFLMDIPYLGALFRTTRQREQKRDLLIMVTPRIVNDQA